MEMFRPFLVKLIYKWINPKIQHKSSPCHCFFIRLFFLYFAGLLTDNTAHMEWENVVCRYVIGIFKTAWMLAANTQRPLVCSTLLYSVHIYELNTNVNCKKLNLYTAVYCGLLIFVSLYWSSWKISVGFSIYLCLYLSVYNKYILLTSLLNRLACSSSHSSTHVSLIGSLFVWVTDGIFIDWFTFGMTHIVRF